jgi:hypothetical protein
MLALIEHDPESEYAPELHLLREQLSRVRAEDRDEIGAVCAKILGVIAQLRPSPCPAERRRWV